MSARYRHILKRRYLRVLTVDGMDPDILPWDGPFERVDANPVLAPEPSCDWERGAVYNAAATRDGDGVAVLYRAEDLPPEEDPQQDRYVSRIGLARGSDGVALERVRDEPVLGTGGPYADYKTRGVEDPRITTIDDEYMLTYTAFDGERINLFLATSDDLVDWDEHGPVTDGKAGAILDEPVDGEYVMYQGDTDIDLLRSPDGYDWETTDTGVLAPRDGMFDAVLVEPGPAPVLTEDGILQVYNACDDAGRYHVGAALFDRDDPAELVARTDTPLLSPIAADRDRRHDHLEAVVFAEGLVELDETYHLYYGSGDETLRVATAPAE